MSEVLFSDIVVPMDHAAFPGHFPGQPVLPGVVLLDFVVLAVEKQIARAVAGVSVAKFHRPVLPGDQLAIELTPDASGVKFLIRHAEGKVADGKLAWADAA
ncbi:beta-hydroxyacyl-ACP dehydratase [Leeia sp. TBRC 13508]|uniref:Beta-hydroxyacyl-ACP dehydratase n=1 Tax=Leeia speluncae TaxID=2884804 RepID=A0ABS8D3Y0_9NEIS|nr:MaoC/PaaZ C-terminal domain-containing protein [Leeia speluncae]MCB6182911.1 beta-hydroxyacyl-ACP dehydratase [Leeia speluncae]